MTNYEITEKFLDSCIGQVGAKEWYLKHKLSPNAFLENKALICQYAYLGTNFIDPSTPSS